MNRSSSATKDKKKGLNVSSQSLNKSAKKKTSQSQYITLSQALIEYPQGQDETKISVVQKFVNEIDLVPNKFHKIETLYLSSNNIKSLEGLEQFSCLRNLSLANNNIDDAASLNVLEELPSIEVLNLNGNPICRLPNYRSLIVSMLPCLRSLDGKPVNVDEKYKSEVNLRTQSSLLDLMLRNYCELIKFNSLNKKLEVHKELLARHQRFARNFVPVDVPTWKKSFDFEKMLDSRSKDVLRANLLKDVDTIKGELELRDEENEVAFSELILRQQQKIAELAVRAEESVKNLTTFFTKASPVKLNDLQLSTPLTIKSSQPSTSALSAKNKPTKALPSDINSASLLDCEPKSLKSILKTNVKTPELHDKAPKLSRSQFGSASTEYLGVSRSHTPQAYPRGKDSITFPASTKNAVYTALTAEKPKAISPISSPFEYRGASPMKQAPSGGHKEECCRTLHKKIDNMDIDTVWNSLVDANKTPFKKRLEEKAKLIENLTRDLRFKNQELIKYESINHQLAERLRDFQNQNRENVKVAQFEIDSLSRELETSLEAQKALEEEITVIKAELSELYQKNFDLEVQNQRLHDAEAKADIYAKELENKAIEEALMETAAVFRAKKLKVKGFKMFKKGIKSFKTENGILECNRIRKQKKLLCLSFSYWKRMTIINGYIKEKNQQKSLNSLKNMFYNWHDYTVNWNKVRGFITETNERKLKKSITAWKQFSAATYKKNILYKKMQQHFIKKTKKRVFKRFVEIRQRVQYDSKAEKTAVKKAQNHKTLATKARLFAAWKKWIKTEAKPLRLKNQKSDKLRNKNLLKFGLKVWTNYMKVNDKVLAKAQRKIARKNLELTAKYLKAWKYFFNTVIPQNKLQEDKKEMFIKKRLLKRWVGQLEAKKKVNACVDKATELYNKHITQRVFKHLAKLRLKRKQLHFFKNAIETKTTHSKMSQYFSKWSVLFKKVKESKKEANDIRVESLSTFFKAWKSFRKTALAKKIKALKVEKHLIRAEKNHAVNIWNGWLNYARLRRRNRDVLELLASRKKATICKNVVFELVKNAKQSLRLKINKMMAKSTLLHAHMRDNNEYVRGLDEERNEMNARTNQYKHELTEATLQLEDKNREINNLRRLVQQYEKNEKNLLEEVSFKSSLTKDLETRFQRNTSENQFVYGEFEKEVELLKNEKAALQKKMVSLEENLDCKQQALKDAERALVEKSNKAQGLISEAERKAANSVKMAGELRNEAEIKEEEVSSLLARLQMSNEEKQELKDKLAEALEAVKDTREFYEGRVRFLEAQNAEMMSNMEYFKEDTCKQQKLIHDLKGELRTSNNRLEAVRSRARLDDETFVKELRRGPTRSPSFGELPEAQSPRKSRLSQVDTIKREYIADKEEYKAKKLDIDRKLATLEVYMGPNQENKMKSPPVRLARSQTNSIGLNIEVKQFGSSIKSKKTDSTTDNESNFEPSTKELLSPLIFARNNSLTPSAGSARACLNAQLLSVKNVQGRDKSPLLSRGSFGGPQDYNSNLRTINDNQFDRSRKERQDRREGLEKRMEVITQSLQADLQKARNRAINGI